MVRHLDTFNVSQRLIMAGMSEAQRECMARILSDIFIPQLNGCLNQAVEREEFQRELHQHTANLTRIRFEGLTKQHEDLLTNRANLDSLVRDLRAGQQRARESLSALRSEIRLDLHQERVKYRDDLQRHLLRLQDVQSRVDLEEGNGRTGLGKLRHDIFYSMIGFFFTSAAALLGFMRLYG